MWLFGPSKPAAPPTPAPALKTSAAGTPTFTPGPDSPVPGAAQAAQAAAATAVAAEPSEFEGAEARLVDRPVSEFRRTLFTKEFIRDDSLARIFSTWSEPDEEGQSVRPTSIATIEGPSAPECQAQAKELAAMIPAPSEVDTNKSLGRPRFCIDVYEIVRDEVVPTPAPTPTKSKRQAAEAAAAAAAAAAALAARPILVEAESCYHDTTDPSFRVQQFTREEMDSMLFLRDVRSVAKVNAAVLKGAGTYGRHQAQGPLGKMLEGDKPVRAVRLGLPRSDAVHALLWILALAANEDATAVLTDDINPYEAFALAGILGNRRVQEVVSIHLRANINAYNVVLCGTLAIEYGDMGLLESCYYWLAAHLVSTGRLVPSFFGFAVDPNLVPAIEGNEFVHRMFRLHQAVFRNISATLTERRTPYSQITPNRQLYKLVRERSTTGEEPLFMFIEPETKSVKLAARYDLALGEYVICRTRTIGLQNADYVGGIRCNLTGTIFTVFDHGQPCQMNTPLAMPDVLPARKEIGVVLYERNILGWEPREFQVALPSSPKDMLSAPPLADQWSAASFSSMFHIKNRAPKWNEDRGTYTLDFRNHVRMASKKNFILEAADNNVELMMMGKVERDHFYIHFSKPLTVLMAFGIALSSFHKKYLVK